MDYCVDCERKLQDMICRSCKTIYVISVEDNMGCHNCGYSMIYRNGGSRTRYVCNYCLYNYFALEAFDPTRKEKLQEYMNCLERTCSECGSRATLNPMNQELVCKSCGLVFEAVIHTRLD